MSTKITLENALTFASSLEPGEWRDAIIYHLEKMDYNSALMVCGEAVLDGLRRETDLSVEELKMRMSRCKDLEKLEKMISALAKEARELRRARGAGGGKSALPPAAG